MYITLYKNTKPGHRLRLWPLVCCCSFVNVMCILCLCVCCVVLLLLSFTAAAAAAAAAAAGHLLHTLPRDSIVPKRLLLTLRNV